jgi:hypothetical protein
MQTPVVSWTFREIPTSATHLTLQRPPYISLPILQHSPLGHSPKIKLAAQVTKGPCEKVVPTENKLLALARAVSMLS